MTDSMKFGPEWLRNLSTDSVNSSGITPSTFGGHMNGGESSQPSQNTQGNKDLSGTANVGSVGGVSRNFLPQFRYGREEMLLLFEKNCEFPEILPYFKNLFVEKVQFPLAMTPYPDEEATTSNSTIMRSSWLQRSPSAFNNSNRGLARGTSADRGGRSRGKSVYHLNMRSNFEEEQRLNVPRSDRSWVDRNGNSGVSCENNSSSIHSDWNTISSPRRVEFSTYHSMNSNSIRNSENWRKNKLDERDNSIDNIQILTQSTANSEGWRNGGNVAFSGNGNSRWGRSTSWRDEETFVSPSTCDILGNPIERSQSSSNTTNDKISHVYNQSPKNDFDHHPSLQTNYKLQKNHNNNASKQQLLDIENDLPEWATEHPSNEGGSFDSLGAFHGGNIEKTNQKSTPKSSISTTLENSNDANKQQPTLSKKKPYQEENQCRIKSGTKSESSKDTEKSITEQDNSFSTEPNVKGNSLINCNNSIDDQKFKKKDQNIQVSDHINKSDLMSEQIKDVTDDMIEKLIMDDEVSEKGSSNYVGQTNILDYKLIRHVPSAVSVEKNLLNSTISNKESKTPSEHPRHSSSISSLQNLINVSQDSAFINNNLITQVKNEVDGNNSNLNIADSTIANLKPKDLWFYRDPQSKVQGPFTPIEMTEWFRAGYFNESLYVRRLYDLRFRPLGELIKICNGHIPFTNGHLLPMNLDQYSSPQMSILPGLNFQPFDQNYEDLKLNVTAAADSVNSAIKNVINTVDMTNMLNIHFQMLQEQYINHQEALILSELSKNDFFQRLTKPEKEAIIRQKVRIPEYLSSLTGLSNSLASLDPSAGDQLYNTLAEYSKKEGGNIRNTQNASFNSILPNEMQHLNLCSPVLNPTELLNHSHPHGDDTFKCVAAEIPLMNQDHPHQVHQHDLNYGDFFLQSKHDMGATGVGILNRKNFPSPFATASTVNKIIQDDNAMNIIHMVHEQQQQSNHPILTSEDSNKEIHTLWSSSTLNEPNINTNITQSSFCQKLEQWPVNLDSNLAMASHISNSSGVKSPPLSLSNINQDTAWSNNNIPLNDKNQTLNSNEVDVANTNDNNEALLIVQSSVTSTNQGGGRAELNQETPFNSQDSNTSTSSNLLKKNPSNVSRTEKFSNKTNEKATLQQKMLSKSKDANLKGKELVTEEKKKGDHQQQQQKKKGELNENKIQITDNDLNDKKVSSSKIRKSTQTSTNPTSTVPTNSLGNKQQTNTQISVAPWSSQVKETPQKGPCLAEIQKAERKEKKADQQRLIEQFQKNQFNNNTFPSEFIDIYPKWNSSTIQVKSIAEIQAEEEKILLEEHANQHKKREQSDNHHHINHTLPSANQQQSVSINCTANGFQLNNAWSGNTAWISNTLTTTTKISCISDQTNLKNKKIDSNSSFCSVDSASCNLDLKTTNKNTKHQAFAKISNDPHSKKNSLNNTTSVFSSSQTASEFTIPNNKTVTIANSNLSVPKPVGKKTNGKELLHESKKQSNKQKNTSNINNGNKVKSNSNMKQEQHPNAMVNALESEFIHWCQKTLNNMNTNVDVPTFVTFLKELESPYEIKDYIRMYLGENKESNDFGKQFLERRSKYKNLQRAQNAHNDDMCKPAPALTPSQSDFNDKGKNKRLKKNKMTKLDSRILGFSVTAAEGRINVGDRDYGDAS